MAYCVTSRSLTKIGTKKARKKLLPPLDNTVSAEMGTTH
jgi:hypothetical protein